MNSLDKKRTEAIALYQMKRYKQAEEAFKDVLAEEPDNYYILNLLANCFVALGRYDEAEEISIKNIPTNMGEEALRLLGRVYRLQGKYKSSEECFLKSLEINPQSSDTLSEYAILLLISGYNKKAVEVMHEAETIDPQNRRVLYYKYYFEYSYGSKKEEIKAIEQFVAGTSDEVDKLIRMGLTEYKRKNYKKARELYVQAFTLEPTNEHILCRLRELDILTHFVFFPKRLFVRFHPIIRFVIIPISAIILSSIIGGLLSLISVELCNYFISTFYITILIFIIWSFLSKPIYVLFFNK